MEKWTLVSLKDVLQEKGYIRGPFGSALRRSEMKEKGIPVYEQQHAIYNQREFRFFINDDKFKKLKRFQVQTNDLIISCSGTVGKVSLIREDDSKGVISQALLILRPDCSKILPEYLKYYFESRDGYNSIISRSSGSVQVNIAKRAVIEQIPIKLPRIEEQEKIIRILKSIDDKIELNTRINNNLESQAKAFYDKLFGETHKFNKGVLSDIAVITMGQSPNGKSYNTEGRGIVFFQGRSDFGGRFPTDRVYTTEPKRIAHCNDVLLSVRAPVGDINVALKDCCIGRGLSAIAAKNEYKSFLFYTLQTLQNELNIFNGDGTVFGSINKSQLNSLPIIIPPEKLLEKFELFANSVDMNIRNNYEEINNLKLIRDLLLPKLISGEINFTEKKL